MIFPKTYCAIDIPEFKVADKQSYTSSLLEDVSILSPASINLMQTDPVPGTYAMGWISDKVSGIPVIGHSGGSAGYQSHIWFSPQYKLGVVVLANSLGAIDMAVSNTEIITTTHLASSVMSMIANRPSHQYGMS